MTWASGWWWPCRRRARQGPGPSSRVVALAATPRPRTAQAVAGAAGKLEYFVRRRIVAAIAEGNPSLEDGAPVGRKPDSRCFPNWNSCDLIGRGQRSGEGPCVSCHVPAASYSHLLSLTFCQNFAHVKTIIRLGWHWHSRLGRYVLPERWLAIGVHAQGSPGRFTVLVC